MIAAVAVAKVIAAFAFSVAGVSGLAGLAGLAGVAAVAGLAGCSDDASDPPMIEQIRLSETVTSGDMQVARTVFGFGTHPLANAAEVHTVTAAVASGNRLRVVVNELMLGNNLEEIECRYVVDDDVFARIPVGATPDDVARCAVAQRQLASECPGANHLSLCVCHKDGGCPSGTTSTGGPIVTPNGESVGVQDRDQDGAADAMRFIAGRAQLTCGAVGAAPAGPTGAPIQVPIDQAASYWTPSGNQARPAQGGFDALGPAIVVVPNGPLPVSQTCGLTFSPEVVDKAGRRLCAPPGGELARGCTPGDTSAFAFTVEPLGYQVGTGVMTTGQSRTAPLPIEATAPLDPVSLPNITVIEGAATPYTQFSVALATPSEIAVQWTAGLAANTRYTIIVPVTVTDTYGIGAPQAFQLSFTTGG